MRKKPHPTWSLDQWIDYNIDSTAGPDECWPWKGSLNRKKHGYGRVDWKGENILVHRHIWERENGRRLRKDERALHRCDNPICCNGRHIFNGTQADNIADMFAKGRARHHAGERHHNAVISNADALAIYLETGLSQEKIGQKYGITQVTVSAIKRGKTWSSVTGSPR